MSIVQNLCAARHMLNRINLFYVNIIIQRHKEGDVLNNKNYYTFGEYMKNNDSELTASMEDYLEMIYRLSLEKGFTRINELSEALHVHAPSATKMVQRLGAQKLLKYEKYGVITLQDEGKTMGEMLIKRHENIETFLKLMGVQEHLILKETEKIEHTISPETAVCFKNYISFINENPDILDRYNNYMKNPK